MAGTGRSVSRTAKKGNKLEKRGYNQMVKAVKSQRTRQTQGAEAVPPARRAERLIEKAQSKIERGRAMQGKPARTTTRRRATKK